MRIIFLNKLNNMREVNNAVAEVMKDDINSMKYNKFYQTILLLFIAQLSLEVIKPSSMFKTLEKAKTLIKDDVEMLATNNIIEHLEKFVLEDNRFV